MPPPAFAMESTGLSQWHHGARQAPGTTDTATPHKIPCTRSHIVLSRGSQSDVVDVLRQPGADSLDFRIENCPNENCPNVSHLEGRCEEARRLYIELRQEVYEETVKLAALLSSPEGHTPEEVKAATLRFP